MDEAVQELKEKEFKDLFEEDLEKERSYVRDVQIETDIEMLITDKYVSNIQERLALYTKIDSLERESEIEKFSKEMTLNSFFKLNIALSPVIK